MDTLEENTDNMGSSSESECSFDACKQLKLENQELKDKLQKLEEQIADSPCSERTEVSVALPKEENGKIKEIPVIGNEKKGGLEFSPEQAKRLKGDYDDVVKKNQELENRILQMAGEMQTEKEQFEATVGAMSKQLMDFVEKMNKLEVESLPSELKDKLTTELDLKNERQPLSHPDWSKKLWRTKSIGATNAAKTEPQSKTIRTPKFSE
ncbi:hypothetical protein AWC38_SpisGene22911 [Stylophora pistillata]|uniref:Uncharacterized protein n=1 Tax=Stylophora pistillata TaxID=50429 RepID=A0A2B4R9K8_STYPI|nr:hypothetical protein AWC38_SpisGene22911 [Stylophora pistillata]